MVYSTDRSEVVVPVLVYSLLLCGLFYEAICFMFHLVLFCSRVFSLFSIAINSLGEERANLSVWEGLRFVDMALPGLFSDLFFYSIGHSKVVVPVLVLLFVALWFILRGYLLLCLTCVILFLCFSVLLALRLTRLGKTANLSAFRSFVQFVLVWFCRFPLSLCVWEGLRFVNVALPGLFSYRFLGTMITTTVLRSTSYINIFSVFRCVLC